MPTEVSGLFSRYWATTDLATLAKLDAVTNRTTYTDEDIALFTSAETQMSSLIGDDPLAEQYQDRVKLFAATHPVTQTLRDEQQEHIDANCQLVKMDLEAMAKSIEKLALAANATKPPLERFDEMTLGASIRTALRQVLASKQLTEFTSALTAPRTLSVYEQLDLKNAVLGLAKMLQEGKLDENSIVYATDTSVYDLRKSSDLVKIADETRLYLRKKFVDEKGTDNLVQTAKDRITALLNNGNITLDQAEKLRADVTSLEILGQQLTARRKAAVKILDVDLKGLSPDEALKSIKEAFRAFRYDLDVARGVVMNGKGEKFRRFWDNFSLFSRPKLTTEMYHQLRDLDRQFNDSLLDLDIQIGKSLVSTGHFAQLPPEEQERASRMREGIVLVRDHAAQATNLTHETNDMIRAYFEEKKGFASDMHKALDTIAEKGGTKSVTISGGAAVGIDAGVAEVKAGGDYAYTVSVSVPKGGGVVNLTCTHAGGLSATAGSKGLPLKVDGGAEVNLGIGETITFETLDDAIAALKGESVITSESAEGVFVRTIMKPFRMLGSGIARFLRWTGALAKKVVPDNLSFRNLLRRSGIMGELDHILSLGRNGLSKAKRAFKYVTGGAHGSVDVGGIADVSADYTGKREFGVKRTNFMPLVDKLVDAFDPEECFKILGEEGRQEPVEQADLETVRNRLTRLEHELDGLVSGATGKTLSQAEAEELASRFRICVAKYARLDHRLSEVGEKDELEATRGLFLKRLANPEVALPEKVFESYLVTASEAHDTPHTVHTITVGGKLKLGSAEPTGLTDAIVDDMYGPGTGLTGQLTIDKPVDKTDPCPWKNLDTYTLDVKITGNLPLKSIIDFVADVVAKHASMNRDEVSDEILGMLAENGIPLGIAKELDSIGELLVKNPAVARFFESAGAVLAKLAPYTDGTYSEGVTLSFTWKGGKFQSFTTLDDMSSSRTIKAPIAGPVEAHVKTAVTKSTSRLSIYPDISLDTAMQRCEECGNAVRFHSFTQWNMKGMLALVKRLAEGREKTREAAAQARLETFPKAKRERLSKRLIDAWERFRACAQDATATNLRKLNALEDYVSALTAVFKA